MGETMYISSRVEKRQHEDFAEIPREDPTDRVRYNRKTYWWRWRLSAVMGCSLVVLVFQENCSCYLRLFPIYSVRSLGKFIKGNYICNLLRWPLDNRIVEHISKSCEKFLAVFYFSTAFWVYQIKREDNDLFINWIFFIVIGGISMLTKGMISLNDVWSNHQKFKWSSSERKRDYPLSTFIFQNE